MLRDLRNGTETKASTIEKRVKSRILKLLESSGPQTLIRLAQECLGTDDPDVKFLTGLLGSDSK